MKKIVITLFIMLALSACSKPIPANKFVYIGYWQGPGMYLEILPDGTFDYQRDGTSISSSVDDLFVVGGGYQQRGKVTQIWHGMTLQKIVGNALTQENVY
ncbi:membrane lipoprotein lipid attachment site-containing protein [Pseudoalteromonas rhizosphaerae]|uniref:membrane lipoprotein lipid attachment site-containing protein n=1 Tax=Pseudoalteromonas rhizosphaerae TaxID=2518973 RepID=UPI00214970C0|nr:membrane lipoprotein lipid attachment site-containing protein [Pseudoalteromonas rhizosphaerae]